MLAIPILPICEFFSNIDKILDCLLGVSHLQEVDGSVEIYAEWHIVLLLISLAEEG